MATTTAINLMEMERSISKATAMEGLTETATEMVVEGSTAMEGSTATGTAMNLTD